MISFDAIDTADKAETLRLLRNECAEWMTGDTSQISPERQQGFFREKIATGEVEAIFLLADGEPAAYALLRWDDQGRAWSANGVSASRRGEGFGRAVTIEIARRAHSRGVPMWATIRTDNERQQKICRAMGYEQVDVITRDGVTMDLMRCDKLPGPLFSVITPTCRAHDGFGSTLLREHPRDALLFRALASMEAQTYPNWQHIVISDGPDPGLREQMRRRGYRSHGHRVFIELGRNWHGFLGGDGGGDPSIPGRGGRGSRGAETALFGTHLAAGDYIGYLDQDCEYEPDHLEVCAKVFETSAPDFVYTRTRRTQDGQHLDVLGSSPPAHGQVDGNSIVHSAELLRTATWRWGGDADWDLVKRWVDAGARWEFIPQATAIWHS